MLRERQTRGFQTEAAPSSFGSCSIAGSLCRVRSFYFVTIGTARFCSQHRQHGTGVLCFLPVSLVSHSSSSRGAAPPPGEPCALLELGPRKPRRNYSVLQSHAQTPQDSSQHSLPSRSPLHPGLSPPPHCLERGCHGKANTQDTLS